MLMLTLSRGKGQESIHLRLPSGPGEAEKALALLENGGSHTVIRDVESNVPNLDYRLYDIHLEPYPDVMSAAQISQATGYNAKTVAVWCRNGKLKSILQQPRYMVPKVWLLDFMASDEYNNICRKSGKHYAVIRELNQK